ncbi:MAG: DUF2442 domain-containing protein [Verrucomicrobiae bacterium]|nr:DUF2442 domain-containing protein [Verrucomicrobiae bacterium]
MYPRVKNVKPEADYTLRLTFTDGQVRVFDVKPYLDVGIFRELKNPSLFNSVRPLLGSIQWKSGQDLCPDMLYEKSVPVTGVKQRPLQVAEAKGRYGTRRKK